MMLRERLETVQLRLAAIKASPRLKLSQAIPGVREVLELVESVERLLAELVNEVEKLRVERKRGENDG